MKKTTTTKVLSWSIGLFISLIYAIPVLIYVSHFKDAPISNRPEDWASLGDYLNGLISSLMSLVNLIAIIWLGFKVHGLETEREEKMYKLETEREERLQAITLRPLCTIYSSDYVNKIKVTVKNLGVGPAKTRKIIIENLHEPLHARKRVKDLVQLLPPLPEGMLWRDYTINGFLYLPAGEQIDLIWLEGDEKNYAFSAFRDQIRKILSNVAVRIEYADIFDNEMEPIQEVLDIFSREY
ncbi:hypothetical protein [Nodosilinea sp. E11]|uniref:hypothetical protein n=1 Tax=Nodosilinea sp. E11 TaxID=3037479 RepID=UPI002934DE49|nr:hypothetical protein [Nodosilinea sp. E11]WOD41703.1 hypothetical protein RRF56_12965 [Nodosilinea sp. E11]